MSSVSDLSTAGTNAPFGAETQHSRRKACAVHVRFIASLKLPFKFYPEDHSCSNECVRQRWRSAGALRHIGGDKRGIAMTSLEMASGSAEPANAEDCFGLGMVFSAGAGVAMGVVQGDKGFKSDAMGGDQSTA